jgi:glutamate/aspartate transport system substrate-binding protein
MLRQAAIVAIAVMLWSAHGPQATASELYGTLAKVQSSGTFTIGYRENSPPFSFMGSDGKPDGYSIELCRAVAEAVKTTLRNSDIRTEYVPVTSANRFELLMHGRIDIECGSTSHTLDRREQVDFSYFIFLTGTRLLVKKESRIGDFRDMDGKRVAVTLGTTNEARITQMNDLLKLAMQTVSVRDHDDGFQAVATGRTDAFASDEILLRGLIRKADDPDLYEVVGEHLSYDPYALVVRRDDAAFRLVVNRTLADLFYRRKLGEIFAKWFDPLGVPMSDSLKAAMAIQMHVR